MTHCKEWTANRVWFDWCQYKAPSKNRKEPRHVMNKPGFYERCGSLKQKSNGKGQLKCGRAKGHMGKHVDSKNYPRQEWDQYEAAVSD